MEPKVIAAQICPYCRQAPVFVDSAEIYGRSYGMIYLCRPCKAWVGVHKGTTLPLGRLANAELRELKKRAHAAFDPIWHMGIDKGFSKKKARGICYKWLAKRMDIDVKFCHIGMFDEKQCQQVINICTKNT